MPVERGPAGLDETDSTRIQRFRVDVGVDGVLAGNARVQMYVAARDFTKTSVHVQTGLYRCSDGGSCTPLASGDKVVPNADRFRLVTVPMGAVDEALQAGDQLELRVVVLDDSAADAWFAYGTAEFPSGLAISRD